MRRKTDAMPELKPGRTEPPLFMFQPLRTRLLDKLELIPFYEHFGLEFDVRQSRDWPDHIGTELEFMHYLSFLEAMSSEEDSPLYVRAQQDFLGRRLGRWAGRFARQVNSATGHMPYGLFAQIVDAFVTMDMRYLRCAHETAVQPDCITRQIIPILPLGEAAGAESH